MQMSTSVSVVPPPPPPPKSATRTIDGRYDLEKILRRGGASTVWIATQRSLRRNVAVKLLETDASRREEYTKRFVREAELAAKVRHHNVVEVIDTGEWNGRPYLVMELLDGDDLQYEIARVGALPWRRAVAIARQVVAGLAAAHRCGVVHRDVKPSNILLTADGDDDSVKVIDFGIARAAEGPDANRLTAAHRAVGTPQYLSPEVAQGEIADARSDQYAVGIVVYEMLTGSVPYRGVRPNEILSKHVRARIPSVREMVGDVPRDLDRIVRRCMAKEPQDRFPSMGELLQALAIVAGETSTVPIGNTQVAMMPRRTHVGPPPAPDLLDSQPTTAVELLASGDYALVEEEPATIGMITKTAPGEPMRKDFIDVDAPPAWPPRKVFGPPRTGATVAVDAVPLDVARPWWKTAAFGLAATLVLGLSAIGGTYALLSDDEPEPTIAEAEIGDEDAHPLLGAVTGLALDDAASEEVAAEDDVDDEEPGDEDDEDDEAEIEGVPAPVAVPAVAPAPEPATLAPPPPPPPPGAIATVGPHAGTDGAPKKRRRGRST